MLDTLTRLAMWVAEKPVTSVIRLVIIVFVSITLWKYYNNELSLYNPSKPIEVSSTQLASIDYSLSKLIAEDEISGAAVLIYQPDGVPKSYSQMITAKTTFASFQELLNLPFMQEVRYLKENTEFYNKLQYIETCIVDSSSRTTLGNFILYNDEIQHMVLYGLYKYGTPYGILAVAYKHEFKPDMNRHLEYKHAKLIETIIFNDGNI